MSDLLRLLTKNVRPLSMLRSLTKKYDFSQIFLSVLLIYQERPEQITHSRSFVTSGLSDLLTVALLTWVTWAVCSQSLMCPEWSEGIANSRSFDLSNLSEWAMSKWAKSQPCTKEKIQNLFSYFHFLFPKNGKIVFKDLILYHSFPQSCKTILLSMSYKDLI